MNTKRAAILIVDDEANIRLTLRTALEADGHEVVEAANGEEGLDVIVRQSARLVILDLSMPVMDGMTVLERLHGMEPQHRPAVIVLTAYGSIPAAVKAMRLGARDFIEKPTTPEALREVVQHVLAEPQPSDLPQPHEATYDEVLAQVRDAMRDGNLQDVEPLLMKAGSITNDDAAFLNLVGVFHEAMGRKDAAKRFYGKAIRINRRYEPAQQNMRRLYELSTLGRTVQQVALGDDFHSPEDEARTGRESLAQRLGALLRHRS